MAFSVLPSSFGNKFKLYLAFIVLGIISSSIIVFAYFSVKTLSSDVTVISERVFPKTKIALEMEGLLNQAVERFATAKAAASVGELDRIAPLNEKVNELCSACAEYDPITSKKVKSAYDAAYRAGVKMVEASIDMEFADEAEWSKEFDQQKTIMLETLKEVVTENSNIHEQSMQKIIGMSANMVTSLLVSFVALSIIGIGTFFLVAGMSKRLEKMSEDAAKASSSLLTSMGYISSMSDQLSNETSSSAASLEEVSASVEIMSSQARENVQIATAADQSTQNVLETASESGNVIYNVVVAMQDMMDADKEISNLVKVIEDIAFQTNLLALNAAVEAARAGEVGAGFAVVADEVRSLALRATDASKEVATVIERLDSKIRQGESVVSELQSTFPRVAESSKIVAEQTVKIIDNSTKQAENQEQTKESLHTIDSSLQSLAAMSEEGAATVQEVNTLVRSLNALVEELMIFWEGKSNNHQEEEPLKELPESTGDDW